MSLYAFNQTEIDETPVFQQLNPYPKPNGKKSDGGKQSKYGKKSSEKLLATSLRPEDKPLFASYFIQKHQNPKDSQNKKLTPMLLKNDKISGKKSTQVLPSYLRNQKKKAPKYAI